MTEKRRNYPAEDRVAPGVYRIDFDRFALRVVVKWKGQRVVDATKEVTTTSKDVAIAERERWAAELRAPYTPTEVLDSEGRVIFRDPPALPPGARFVIGIDLGRLEPKADVTTFTGILAPRSKLSRALARLGPRRHDDCDCSSCLPWTY